VLGLPLRILEFGGGTGEFASNLMAFLSTIHDYIIVDISEGLRRQQKAKDIRSVKSLDGLSSIPTFAFGNEVLDALPVHRVMGEGTGQLLELYVSLDEREEFTEMPDHPSTPLLGERLRSEGVTLGRGQVAEICLDFEDFLKGIGEVISKGYLVFIDYGDEASTLYSFTQRNGTLRSFQAQHRVFDPFDCIGDQDLTADVDFTALKMAARKAGFLPVHHSRQGTWLQDLGIEKYVNLATHTEAARNEIFQLTHPARLGSTFDVVIFKRGE
jgi:SAM-dependent MidA family methyltransferase